MKKLDTQMVRNIYDQEAKEELEKEMPGYCYDEAEDFLDIPKPTFGTGSDFGDSDQENLEKRL